MFNKSKQQQVLIFVGGIIMAALFCAYLQYLLEADNFPATSAIEDAFLSEKSPYQDGDSVVDLDGYMSKNGFAFKEYTTDDRQGETTFLKRYVKNKTSISVITKVQYGPHNTLKDKDCDMVEFEILVRKRISHSYDVDYQTKKEYVFQDLLLSDIVYDNDSAVFTHRDVLTTLDQMLKSGNLKNEYLCPFANLGVEHYTMISGVYSLHDD